MTSAHPHPIMTVSPRLWPPSLEARPCARQTLTTPPVYLNCSPESPFVVSALSLPGLVALVASLFPSGPPKRTDIPLSLDIL